MQKDRWRPSFEERNVVLATILFCILPLPFIVESLDFSLWDSNREGARARMDWTLGKV